MAEITEGNIAAVPENAEVQSSGGRTWVWLLGAFLVFGGVIVLLAVLEDTVDVKQVKTAPPLQLVSVEDIPVKAETAEVSAFSEVQPRWSADMRAAVSGRVIRVRDSAFAGAKVKAGEVLIEIENSRYAAELAAAEFSLKEAQLALWKARNATLLARKEFERFGRKPPNDLALKLPQLDIAKSSVESAEARVASAKRQLADATITAPFSGFVTERFVSPGQSVNVGDQLVKLVDNTAFELTVELSRGSWNLLKQPIAGQLAKVISQSGKVLAEARVRQGGGFLDEKTRQYKVFLEISSEGADKVLSGDFVRVQLPGVNIPAALNIPATALTQEGYVWRLDVNDRLQRTTPKVLFRRQSRIVVEAPKGGRRWRVVVTPLASFLPGQKVRAKVAAAPSKSEG